MYYFPPSHMDQGLLFGTLGLWHLLNALRNFVKQPSHFRSHTWFPSPLPGPLRYLELWSLLLIVLAFICKQLYRARSDLASGTILSEHLERFQHVAFALFFLVYLVAALCSQHPHLLPLPDGVLHATFALGFLVELLVFHLGHHPGDNLKGFVHDLMQIILAFLSLLMFLEILWPHSFLISVGRCMLLFFKGTWFFQIGVLINVPWAIPLGCQMGSAGFPVCESGDARARAKSIQVLVFVWQMAGILVLTYVLYWVIVQMDRGKVGSKGWDKEADDEAGAMAEEKVLLKCSCG